MLPYWLFFLIPAVAAFAAYPRMRLLVDGTRPIQMNGLWLFILFALTSIIGFRYEVGGDWVAYVRYYVQSGYLSWSDALVQNDPGYWALNKISDLFGFGVTGVNLLSGLILSIGLVVFCRSLPRPWLALACAMPYLVTVVAMGYTRQSIALGFIMIGFVMLRRKQVVFFLFWVIVGALFHRSSVLLIPIAGLTVSKHRLMSWLLVAVTTMLGYFTLLADSAADLISAYVDKSMQSAGAFIRLAMNAFPAFIFLLYFKRFDISPTVKKLWLILSLLSIAMFVAFFLTNISTALDRMALYIIPLQLVVFAHLPDVIGVFGRRNQAIVALILLYYATTLFIWLNFAKHSDSWLPYQMGTG